ncbi:uncharacterized protein LOC112347280 [Selaginella moellendorffii]|uniref:uncharacterized protein LOC112347280 n=1 Tax=Selaginella moellendorffii TaxID=88036 RepID=UPI000D1C8098|nr:uncharacterized protein LOC112347280 [Selaginella moellendorffii]|eukprot:XP_024533700.1 uncharacterized protein LOC112347280 [Selaginella moellendorffii]
MDRCGVVQGTMELIQSLKNQVQELSATRSMLLEHRKSAAMDPSKPKWNAMAMAAAARSSASVGLHICKSDVFVNMSCRMQARLLLSVLWILRQHQLIVQDASVSVDDASRVACICIRAKALDIDHFAKESLELSLKSFGKLLPCNASQLGRQSWALNQLVPGVEVDAAAACVQGQRRRVAMAMIFAAVRVMKLVILIGIVGIVGVFRIGNLHFLGGDLGVSNVPLVLLHWKV